MTKTIQRPLAFLSAVGMTMAMLLYFPGGTFDDTEWGQKASAEGTTNDLILSAIAGDPEGFLDDEYTKLFDNNTGTEWFDHFRGSAYVIFQASEPVKVSKYSIATARDAKSRPNRSPKEWTLSACMNYTGDTTSWTVIDTVTDGGLPAANETYTDFTLAETTPYYQYFKLEITSNGSDSFLQISEIALKDYTLCEHQWEATGETFAPTCTEGGYYVEYCPLCQGTRNVPTEDALWHDFVEVGTDTFANLAATVIPALGHDMTEHPANAATCTNPGNYAYWTCSYENGVYYKNEAGTDTFANLAATVIPAHGHDMTEHPASAATCTNPGNYAYWTCSYENGVYYKDEAGTDTFENLAATVIPALGHDMTEHPASAATCTESGNYAYWTCSYEDGVYYKDKDGTDTFANLAATVIPASNHDYTSGGICEFCAALENGKDGFRSVSLTLTDSVILNYYLLLSEDALADTGAYIHFTSANGIDVQILLSEGTEDNGKYKFSLELRPDQMAEVITAQVIYTDGSTGNCVDYSVQQYANGVTDGDKGKALVDAMLKYGAYTQLYTGKNTDNLAVPVGDYTTNASIDESYKYTLDGTVSGVAVKGATLQIGAYTTIRLKYQLAEGADIQNYTFKCDDTVLTPEKYGNYYYIYLRNIRPQDLDEMYSFTVSDGTNTTTFTYSAFTYMKNVLDNAESYDQTLVNLINAMYDYHQAAEAYLIG